MDQKDRINLCEWVLEHAIHCGANQADVSLSNAKIVEIEFCNKQLEKLKKSTQNSLNLALYINQKYSLQSTNDLRKELLKNFIEQALTATKYLEKDKFRSLPEWKYYPGRTRPDLKICDSGYNNIKSKERINFASTIEASAMIQSNKIISTTAYYQDKYTQAVKMHSTGFLGESRTTSYGAGAEVTVKDDKEGRPEDWYYARTRFYNTLPSPEFLGKQAAMRALRKIGQQKIKSGIYDMLVENRAGRTLISMLQGPMQARYLQQRNSYLENMLGKCIASENLTFIDDPTLYNGLASRHYDAEGLAAKKRTIIEKGILKNYYIDNYYGKKLNMEATSGSTSNLIFRVGEESQESLIKDMKRGILVTEFIGGNSNNTTGDFSFGVAGLLIEDGEVIKPVNEMNISGNAKEFWKRLSVIANDSYPYSSWRIPSMLFEKVHFSGL